MSPDRTREVREWIKSVGFPIVVALLLLWWMVVERRDQHLELREGMRNIERAQQATTQAVTLLVERMKK